ncbi:penicillin-binding protein 1C [Dyadobacter helix]
MFKRAALISGGCFLTFLLLDFTFPFRAEVDYSSQILAKDGTVIHTFLSGDDKWRLYADISEITPLLRKTLIHKEDKFFYYHPGINPLAMLRAAALNMVKGRRTSGASTITMQVVRLLEPRKRTYFNKILESFRALQLEFHYSKEEILLMYLNRVPYGGNIEGIKAASLLYFGKLPQLLSLAEIMALTIVPNRPSGLQPGRRNEELIQARNRWLLRFEKANLFDKNVIQDALREPLVIRRLAAPRLAPHFSQRLKKEFPDQKIVRSNLNLHLQRQIEGQVKNYINRLNGMNIHNAAVLVVNNETMAVEAYVGSADFFNPYDGGQVDGIRAVRSPGSTLKPLLYATAFDKGMLTPRSVVYDVPTNFAGYEPENFDQRFNGAVTAGFALSHSLNIPAVRILRDMGTAGLVGQLRKAGFRTVARQEKDLGLSMILGGCGVTLEELTRLFAVFSNKGKFRDLRYIQEHNNVRGSTLISEESSFLLNNILTQVTRPDLPTQFDNTYHLPRIAWKTGTSYGKRDAWSVGYNKKFTVGVWVGNFSGQGVPELSGANTATPLLFSVFNSLDYNSEKGWYTMPQNVALRKVCAVTGDIPSDFCSNQITDYYIMGVSSYQKCRHLKWVYTDKNGEMSYCTYCLPEKDYEKRALPDIAPELVAYYEIQKIPYPKLPPHNPACERVFHEGAPMIISPNDGSEYYIRKDEAPQLQLSCQAQSDAQEVFWYLNDKLFKKAGPQDVVFINPPLGRVKISCSDDKGRNTDIWIDVKRM